MKESTNNDARRPLRLRAPVFVLVNILLCVAVRVVAAEETVTCTRISNPPLQRVLEGPTNASADVDRIVKEILGLFGRSPNTILAQPVADVSFAEVCRSTEEPSLRILFSTAFFSSIDKTSPLGWAKIAVLAHEVGHILNSDFTKVGFGTNPKIELEADQFAGEALAKYGLDLVTTREAYNLDVLKIGGEGNAFYPSLKERLLSVERGWRRTKDPELVFAGDDARLEHNYGQAINGSWVSKPGEAQQGYMSFGPYVKLNSGVYKISFLYKCNKDESATVGNNSGDAIYFEVAEVDATAKRYSNSHKIVPLSGCDNSIGFASWLFNVDEVGASSDTFEFRVFSFRNAEIKLREIKVEKIVTF